MNDIEKLKEMYETQSKHSNYQVLSSTLSKILPSEQLKIYSRYENERLEYILKKINVKNRKVLDVGGNTGYFSFEVLEAGASSVVYFEGNHEHAEFVKLGAKILGLENRLNINNEYFNFDTNEKFDVSFILNVLHHLGDDFGDQIISKSNALKRISQIISEMGNFSEMVVLQLGFNWKGNKNFPLFENGYKEEVIEFVKDAIKGKFELLSVGVPVKRNTSIVYEDLNDFNLKRFDSLGEFLNRPLFILEKINVKT